MRSTNPLQTTLSDLCELITDGTHFSPATTVTGDFMYVTSKNVRAGRMDLTDMSFVSRDVHETIYSGCPVAPGDVLFVKDGANTGLAAINEIAEPFSMLSSVALIRPKPHLLDAKFLMHWLNSPVARDQMLRNMSGAAIKRLVLSQIRQTFLCVPPLDEQRRIAAILDQADDLRRKRRDALGRLDVLGQTLLHQSLQFARDAYHPLAELCRKVTDGTHQAPAWTENGVPFLFVSNIRNQSISMETSKFVSETTFCELTRRTPIEIGDVLYTAVGSYGFAATVRTAEKFIFQRHVAHIKPKHEVIDSTFLSYLLESVELRQHADKVAVGLAQKTVTLEELKKFPIPLPPLPLQRAFAARVAEIDKLKAHHRAHLARLDALFASLQHRAFRGDLPAPKGETSPCDSFSHGEKVAPRSGVG